MCQLLDTLQQNQGKISGAGIHLGTPTNCTYVWLFNPQSPE